MKAFLILSLFSFLSAASTPTKTQLRIAGENLKFTYQSFEGEHYIRCVHEVENLESGDWKVLCQDGSFKREYSVHLWINQYRRLQAPKTSFETLYWVNERFPNAGTGHSTTNWIHVEDSTNFYGASLSVGVDSETAGLYLDVATSRLSNKRRQRPFLHPLRTFITCM